MSLPRGGEIFVFTVKGENLTDAQIAELTSICTKVSVRAKQAASGNVGKRAAWFGANANSPSLSEGLRTMSDYLNGKCTVLTFVRKNTGQIVDQAKAEDHDYGQVVPNIFQTTANFKKSTKHTSSGLRIFAMNEIVNAIASNDEVEKINYVYHELSHKVLDTVDFQYGETACRALAASHPGRALRNADNWGYYIAYL